MKRVIRRIALAGPSPLGIDLHARLDNRSLLACLTAAHGVREKGCPAGDRGLKEREMSGSFVGCMHCGFIAEKNDGYVASWRWCPECGSKLRGLAPTDIDLIAEGGERNSSPPMAPPENPRGGSNPGA